MAVTITMPKLGLTMTEGVVSKWFKKEGETVTKGEVLFEVETDKMTNQMEADCDGVLLKIAVPDGGGAQCGETLAYIGEAGEDISALMASAPVSKETAKPSETTDSKEETVAKAAVSAPVSGGYVLATPAAKELAKKKGINIANVKATGPNGSVILKDVEGFAPSAAAPAKTSGLAAKIAAELGIDVNALSAGGRVMSADVLRAALNESSGEDVSKPLSTMRKTIARRMSESWNLSPRVCYEIPVDCTAMAAMRQKLKKSFEEKGLKLTYNHIIIKACAKALTEFPEINASVDGDTLILHPSVNIGLAVGVDNGLLVPNIKNCAGLGLESIAALSEDMIKRARSGKLGMDELTGGTFTITNIGMFGVRSFSPIINQPELAILGVNAIIDTPVVKDGEIVIRPMMNLNLVADHRIVDGVLAAKFFARIVALLETPALMLM